MTVLEFVSLTRVKAKLRRLLTDLYCYPIFHVFEYNKGSNEYWRFCDVTLKKFYLVNGKLDGYGLKFFPDKTKKSLKFFETHF